MTTLSDYYKMLQAHDWHYEMSDDRSVYKRGQAERTRLRMTSEESAKHAALYTDYYLYVTQGKPKPQEPMEKAFRTGEQDGHS